MCHIYAIGFSSRRVSWQDQHTENHQKDKSESVSACSGPASAQAAASPINDGSPAAKDGGGMPALTDVLSIRSCTRVRMTKEFKTEKHKAHASIKAAYHVLAEGNFLDDEEYWQTLTTRNFALLKFGGHHHSQDEGR